MSQGFDSSRKCWTHLIRKANKLTLQDPENPTYRHLAEELIADLSRCKEGGDQITANIARRKTTEALRFCNLPGNLHDAIGKPLDDLFLLSLSRSGYFQTFELLQLHERPKVGFGDLSRMSIDNHNQPLKLLERIKTGERIREYVAIQKP